MSAMQKFGRGAGGHMQRKPLNASNRAGAPLRRNNIGLKERTGVGGGRGIGGANNGGGNGGVVAPNATEETYQLLSPASCTPPPFAMMIRLTPEILEELKRVEEEGGKSVMKFGNNSSGHVIKVGNDEFKFSSVLEPGDLCDIYEEKQRGEDAQGLLVESGSVWRKLSVQRILSATEKDRVKKRSQEAEQKQKSRKAIILDHSGSLLSTQTASTAPATDANTRRLPVKTMKEPPLKKRKMESPVATIVKPKSQSTNPPPSSSNRTSSPVPLSPDPSYVGMQGPSSSQAGGMPPPKALSTSEGRNTDSPSDKGNAAVQKDKISISALAAAVESGGYAKAGLAVNMTELRNLLIILLKENPKGMTIKAVEKALGEVVPNANPERKNIEKVIRLIASYQAPGKYLLNEGVDTGTLAKPPWSNEREQLKDRDMSEPCDPVRNTEIERIRNDGSAIDRLDEQKAVLVRQESIPQAANILPDPKKPGSSSAKCLGPVNTDGSDTSSSSESGSGSETDSESSGSGSGSDSGSGSGSDSDSEASSSSSEDNNMDEDVDIISEDENENRTDARQKHKPKDIKAALSKNDYKVQNKPQHDVQFGESKIINSGLNEMPAASNGSEDIDIADALEDGTIDKMTSELVKEVFGSEEDADTAVQVEVISFEGDQVSCELKSGSAVYEKDGDACDKLIDADVGNRSVVGRKISSQMVQSSQDKGTAKSVHELDHNIGTEARDRKEIIKMCEGDAHTDNELMSAKNEQRLSILGGKAASQHEKDELPFGSKGQAARKFGEKTSQRLESVDAKTQSIDATIHDVPSRRGLSESLESGKGQFSGSPLRGRDGIPQMEKFGKEDLFSRQILETRKSSATDVAETGKLVKNLESSYQQKRPTDSMLKDRPAIPQQHLSRFGSNPEASGRLQQEEEILTKHTESMMKTFKDQELFGSKGKYGDTQSRERTHGSNNHASMRQTEIAGRPPKDMPQHSQQKDNGLFGPPSKVNAHSSYVNKDPDQSNCYERDVEHAKANKDSCKAMRSGRPGDEVKKSNSDRMGHVEKAERPPREPDCQTRAKESSSKSNSWRDSDPGGRMLNNGIKEVRNKNVESERLLLSGATNSSFEADRNIHDLELGELREQVHEDQAQPSRVMSLPSNKDYKSIQGFETSGRAVTKKDEGFNLVEKSQSAHRTGIDMRKPSPILSGNDLGNSLQESSNGKRRLDGNEISDLERPSSKRTLLQQHLSKEEMPASGASGRKATTDMLSPSPPDRQDHSRKSATKGVLETSCEQDFKERGHESSSKELSDNRESISERQKFRIVHARESPKAEPLPNQTKKQTPTSSEVQGGDFFAPYEKKAPQLRGSIKSYEQYKEYCEEYHEKYLIYYRLHTVLESDKSDFELLRRDIEQAKSKGDKTKLASIYGKVRKDYLQCRKRFKRMRHTFLLLHEELQIMKQHCIEYAGKVGRR